MILYLSDTTFIYIIKAMLMDFLKQDAMYKIKWLLMQNSMIPLIYTDKLILNNFKLALNKGCKGESSTRKN